MKVRNLSRDLKKFIMFAGFLILVFLAVLTFFGLFYRYSTINTYNLILLILILLTIIITVFCTICTLTVLYVYKRKKANWLFLRMAGAGIKLLLPVLVLLSGIFKSNKDDIRRFYIDFNNLMMSMSTRKYKPEEIIVLLPHCLQYSECTNKITNDIDNCKRCGACTIGDIAEICSNRKIKVQVVTGGTSARNIIYKTKPGIILAVACERDLTSGIIDVGKIKVVGLINERPNGPCFNTRVDIEKLKTALDNIME
ncbi:MAG: DUF116 domain-containing protein [Clostridiaceae bacterium]|nr:DUF116 domain-containing protein [Clostridiaceae bacterium]